MNIIEENFGFIDDKEVKKITLLNDKGSSVSLINYGAIIQYIILPDRFGESAEIT